MRNWIRLSLFPVLGALFLGVGILGNWAVVAVLLRRTDQPAEIVGFVKSGPARWDVVYDVEREVVVTAPGWEWRQRANAREAVAVSSPGPVDETTRMPADVRWALLFDDSGAVERAGQRLARQFGPAGPLTVLVVETARGHFGLTRRPDTFAGERLAPIAAGQTLVASFDTVVNTLSFSCTAEGRVKERKLEQVPARAAIEPERADFVFAGESWRVEYRPIFRFQQDGVVQTRLADIGRIFSPPRAFPLGGRARVALTGAQRDEAMLLPDLGYGTAPQGWLSWFTAKSEAIFSRWAYALVILSFGVGFAFLGLVLLSLQVWPGRHLQATIEGANDGPDAAG